MIDVNIHRILLTKENIDRIKFLNNSCFPSKGYTIKGIRWFVASAGKEDIAFTSLYKDGERVRIFRMGVLKPFRGKGLQRKLIRFMEEYSKGHFPEGKYITAETYFTNVPSANNFIKCGFLLFNPKKKRDAELLYFSKPL